MQAEKKDLIEFQRNITTDASHNEEDKEISSTDYKTFVKLTCFSVPIDNYCSFNRMNMIKYFEC
jgi:hypothetical protein